MRQYKVAAIALIIASGTGSLGTLPAEAVNLDWSVTSLNHAGSQVGSGSFHYDPDTLEAVGLNPFIRDYRNVTLQQILSE
ncbi:MAG: hypothetical protein DCF22_25560 [Leptolyngbya sp.]|nr:MAG: hypothetical protein DCF22_25560 [Leptolyngbya sp.]